MEPRPVSLRIDSAEKLLNHGRFYLMKRQGWQVGPTITARNIRRIGPHCRVAVERYCLETYVQLNRIVIIR